jgi:hypothetical protein
LTGFRRLRLTLAAGAPRTSSVRRARARALPRARLDERRRLRARELRREGGVLVAQHRALAAELVEADVQLQDGDVERDEPARSAPTTTIQTTPLRSGCGAPCRDGRGRRRARRAGGLGVATRTPSDLHRDAKLRRRARGLCATSSSLGRSGRATARAGRLVPADADREVGRARAAALAVAHEGLYDPILERVEADHREPAGRPQSFECCGQRTLERTELVIDRDAQGLEDALRRMTVTEARGAREWPP